MRYACYAVVLSCRCCTILLQQPLVVMVWERGRGLKLDAMLQARQGIRQVCAVHCR